MAKLKKEQSEIKYVDQIGINTGGGFAVAARGEIQTANAFNQIVSDWSQFALRETKEWGKKLGEKTASEYDFGYQEVQYTDPNHPNLTLKQKIPTQVETPKYLTTASAIDAFEKDIFIKYRNEVMASVDGILSDERTIAERNYDTAENYEAIVKARLEPLLTNLDPDFKQIIETYSNKNTSSNVRMVASRYDRHQELIRDVQYTSEHKATGNELNKALIYDDADLIAEKLQKFTEVITVAQGNDNYKALGNGKQDIADAKSKVKVFKLFSGIHIKDIDNATPLQLTNTIENYKKISSLLQFKGPNEINLVLSDGNLKKITKKEVNKITGNNLKVFEDISSALYTQATTLSSLLNTKVSSTNHYSTFDYNLNNGGKDAILPAGVSRTKYAKDIFSPEHLPVHIAKYNSLLDSSEHITIDSYQTSDRFVKWVLTEQHVLPPIVKQTIETAYTSFNQESITELRNSSIITFMNDFQHTFSKDIDGTNKGATVSLDIFSVVGIPKNIQNRIFAIESKLRLNPNLAEAVASTADFYSKFDQGVYTNLSQALAFGSGKRITNVSEVNAYINEEIVNILDTWTTFEPSLPQTLAHAVKNEVHEYIMKGHPVEKLSDLNSAIKSSMMLVLSGETGFGFSEYTYSPFVNMKYDASDYKKRKHFVMDHLETYSLPEKIEIKHDILGTEIDLPTGEVKEVMSINWMLPHLEKLIKDSPSYETMKPFLTKDFKKDFGNQIQVQSTGVGTNKFPKYNLVWVDNNGQADYILDDSGLPIFFDPFPLYKELSSKLVIEDSELNEKIENYKLQRIDKIKNYKKVSAAQMLMDLD